MAEYTENLRFTDPLHQLGVPKLLGSLQALQLYASGAHYVKDWSLPLSMSSGAIKEWTQFLLRKAMQKATVVVAPLHELDAMICAATGKTPDKLLEDDYLEIITELDLTPNIVYPNGFKRINRFAFVTHRRHPERDARCKGVPCGQGRQGHRRDGHDRHRHIRCRRWKGGSRTSRWAAPFTGPGQPGAARSGLVADP